MATTGNDYCANDYYLLMVSLLRSIFPPSRMLQTKSQEMRGENGEGGAEGEVGREAR